jgi:tripartite-type tricarboxylate transporter receptor subunit TctC
VLATSGASRSLSLPDVPTFAELGHKGLVIQEWFAFFAPGRTPKAAVAALSAELQEALARPAVATAFAPVGMTAVGSSPQALAARITTEQRFWQPVLRALALRDE